MDAEEEREGGGVGRVSSKGDKRKEEEHLAWRGYLLGR